MTRRKVFNGLKKVIADRDLVFCIGELLSKESNLPDNLRINYFNDLSIDYLSVALGIAMASDNRVFFICEDSYFIQVFNSAIQASVSECANLYILVIRTDENSSSLKQVSVIKSIRSLKGTLFNLGFLVHDYTPYFDNSATIKQLVGVINSSIGPLVGLISVNSNRLYGKDDYIEFNDFGAMADSLFENGAVD